MSKSDYASFSSEVIYILPNSMSKNYLQDLKKATLKNNFNVCDEFK